jgi:fumarylpyruvate hydrolase
MQNSTPEYCFPPAGPSTVRTTGGALFPVHRVYCIGQNYAAHVRELGGNPDRDAPIFFSKPADAVTHALRVPYPPATTELHHEVELVVALGKGGSKIAAAEALSLVYGYAVGVDLTRRDLQNVAKKLGTPWDMSKGFDFSAPISAIVPAADAGNPGTAAISLAVNGWQRQAGNIAQMVWSVAEIISELSALVMLQPGDLIFTGTPEGVGPLEAGDQVLAKIDAVGELQFQVV